MRQHLRVLAACGLLLGAVPAASNAQQGSIKISAAAHTTQGDQSRLGTQPVFEPDLTVSWLRPGTRFGTFQMDIRGTTRDGAAHLGRSVVSLRGFQHRGITYSFDAGDAYFSPRPGDNQLRNLYTPTINFSGLSASGKSARTDLAVMVGRASMSRNFFGTDADTLDQDLFLARGSWKTSDRLEISGRTSRIRTRDLKEYTFNIASSDQAGGAAKLVLTPAVHLIADGSVVSFRRRDGTEREVDGSVLAGTTVLLARGWFEVNASRFSPGELPVIAQPHADRRTFYAAGEYDVFSGIRAFGGWDSFRTNLDGRPSLRATPAEGNRAFGGLRVPLGTRSSTSVRFEEGDRRSRFVGATAVRVSDTGVLSGELQSTLGALTAFARLSRRENVESDSAANSYTQTESSGLVFFNPTRQVQLFGSVTALRNEARDGSGRTYWQFGGGTQAQIPTRNLWVRGEGLFSRNSDLAGDFSVPQQTINIGINGEIAPDTVLGFMMYADRLQAGTPRPAGAWLVRSTLRVTRTFATGSASPSRSLLGSVIRHGGTGSLAGIVYTDWNANGLQEPDEEPVQNIPIRLTNLGNASTSKTGEFSFANVPIGLQQVGIDMSSLPVDFDPPAVPQVQVELGRGEIHRVEFGLVPLGSIAGRVLHDTNANGSADDADQPLADAVVVLDGGARSEQVRSGRFRFDAVRSGEHTITLLQESLPEGGTILGEPRVAIALGRESLAANATFLVTIQRRPEIRRVFPGGRPVATPAPSTAPGARAGGTAIRKPVDPAARPPSTPAGGAATSTQRFEIQIAALSDPARAARLVEQLRQAGYSAYLVEPPASKPDAPYKVRIGSFESKAEADAQARSLEKARGEKVWVIRER